MTTKRSIRMLAIGVVLAVVQAALRQLRQQQGRPAAGTTGGAASDTVAAMVFGGGRSARPAALPPGPRDHLRAEVQGLRARSTPAVP
jgi:hypothetical protein